MLRIGVVGTGRIVERFITECDVVSDVDIVAIYNPNLASVIYFAENHGIDEKQILLTDDKELFIGSIDAVYIAAPHEVHYDYAKEFLLAGKHVLCEKPMALSGEEAAELYALADEKHLILMEAIKTASAPGFQKVLSLLDEGVIGQPYDVEACFSKIGSASGREIWGEFGGSFTELGSYSLLPIVKILGTESINSYIWSLDSAVGTDSYTKISVCYPNGIATAKAGLGVKSDGELMIAGDRGYIHVPSPWWLTKKIEVRHENPNEIEEYEVPFEGSGLRYEIQVFSNRIEEMDAMAKDDYAGVASVDYGKYVTPEESIWMAYQMEYFLSTRQGHVEKALQAQEKKVQPVKYWAHRGCSMNYPENTLLAFQKAAEVKGIAGIELDVHLTKDQELVVIHDEKVNRTTNGNGYVKDMTLVELKQLAITPSGREDVYRVEETGEVLRIPTLSEVFELLKPYCLQNQLMINIELKNSVIRYEGMEQKVIDMVAEFGLEDYIVYSSFLHESVGLVKELNPNAKTGTLASDMLICLAGARKYHADALHPGSGGMAINQDIVDMIREEKIPVRMWTSTEPLFGQSRKVKKYDLDKYALLGATDIITNAPEVYLNR